MGNSTALEIILNKYHELNNAEQRVARIVQNNPEKAVKMTIKELAEHGKTSETTVFRFCDKLGYSGFSEFKINLALGLFESEKELHSDINKEDDTYIVSQKMLTSYINSAKATVENNKTEVIDQIVEKMLDSNALYFFGMGGSYSIADDARHKFVRFNQNSFSEADLHWQSILISTSKPADVCFLFSSSGSNKDLIELIPDLQKKGVITVGITGSASSPLAAEVDYHLTAYEEGAKFVSEAMESRQTTMLLIDILFVAASLKKMKHVEDQLLEIRKGIAKRRV